MSLNIVVQGKKLHNFQNATVTRSIETLCGWFSFTSTSNNNGAFPVRAGDAVDILVNDERVLTGFVDKIVVSYSKTEHLVSVFGRDILSDVVDSTVKGRKEFAGAIALETIIRAVLDDLGIDAEVINQTGEAISFSEEDIMSAENGQTAFKFIEKCARKKQVLVSSDADGNLLLVRSASGSPVASLTNKLNGVGNNILSAEYVNDQTRRFNEYVFLSKLGLYLVSIGATPKEAAELVGTAFDRSIRNTRYLEINADETMDGTLAVAMAIWEANIRQARGISYSCAVQGHSHVSGIWAVNTLALINDDFTELNETDSSISNRSLLIKRVTFSSSVLDGNTTSLELTRPDSYKLAVEEDV